MTFLTVCPRATCPSYAEESCNLVILICVLLFPRKGSFYHSLLVSDFCSGPNWIYSSLNLNNSLVVSDYCGGPNETWNGLNKFCTQDWINGTHSF